MNAKQRMWRRRGMVVSFGTFSSMVRRLCCGSTSYIPQRTTFHGSLQDNTNQIIAITPHLVTAFSTALPLDAKRHTTRPCERVKQQKDGRAVDHVRTPTNTVQTASRA